MSFWEDAFTNIGDNLTLVKTAILDGADNLNPMSDQFLSGDAKRTAAEAERQNAEREGRAYDERRASESAEQGVRLLVQATKETGAQATKKIGEVVDGGAKAAGSALDALTNPWIVVPVLVLVGLVVAAPYVTPLLPKKA